MDYLVPVMEDTLDMNVIVGPSLMATGEGGLDDETYSRIQQETSHLMNLFSDPSHDFEFSYRRVPLSLIQQCLLETLSSTAAYYSHIRLGELSLSDSMIAVARTFYEKLVQKHTPRKILEINFAVNFYDNAQVIRHYRQISKDDFVSGKLHRPWIRYDLKDELNIMLEQGSVETIHGNENYIRLTNGGLDKLALATSFLNATGFLKKRASLMRFSRFSSLEDYDELIESISQIAIGRKNLLYKSGIQQGMRVLELGCGTGGLTIDTGLHKLVEPYGSVVATDPSLGMLRRGQRRAESLGVSNVEFFPMAAEELSFKDNTFDAVTGSAFFHFVDMERAVHEIHRVLKPSGVFSTAYPLRFTQSNPVIGEWFKPLLDLSPLPSRSDSMPEPHQAPEIISRKFNITERIDEDYVFDYSIPENVVRFFVQIANVFEDSMNQLPWQAQQDMLQTLIVRGYEMVDKYSDEELHPKQPSQLIKAYAVK